MSREEEETEEEVSNGGGGGVAQLWRHVIGYQNWGWILILRLLVNERVLRLSRQNLTRLRPDYLYKLFE